MILFIWFYSLIGQTLAKKIFANDYFIYVTLPFLLLVLSSVLLWLTFVFLGLIAKRYQIVLRTSTRWHFMVIAPLGMLLAALVQLYVFVIKSASVLKETESWTVSILILVSSLGTLWGAWHFHSVISRKKKTKTRKKRKK